MPFSRMISTSRWNLAPADRLLASSMIAGKFQRNIVLTMQIRTAVSGDDFARTRELFREYVKTPGVEVCVSGFEEELGKLDSKYFAVLLAWDGDEAVGCGALREIGEGRAEMKRVYLRPEARGQTPARNVLLKAIGTTVILDLETALLPCYGLTAA